MLPITQFFAMRMKRRGVEMRLIIGGADAPPRKPDPALLKAIALAHRWFEELISARATSLAAIASSEGVTDRYVARLIRLAFLAPKIVEAITERGELADLKLTPHVDLPLDWRMQKRVIGFEEVADGSDHRAACSFPCPRHRQPGSPRRLAEAIAKPNQPVPARRETLAQRRMTPIFVPLWFGWALKTGHKGGHFALFPGDCRNNANV